MLELAKLKKGVTLPELKKVITQEGINRYAEASHDFNPIHIDMDYAKQTPLGGTIAHGMLVLAYVSQMMVNAFGRYWLSGSKLNVRFKAPARPGDTITVSGRIDDVVNDDGHSVVSCDLLVTNQHDEVVITGEAIVRVDSHEDSG